MALTYGFVKCRVISKPKLKPKRQRNEIQYHLHASLRVGTQTWDTAINVGTNDSDDLLRYRFAFDFRHPILETLRAAKSGFTDLTGQHQLPALDFLRSDVLANTGSWRDSAVMDGSTHPEPVATLLRLLTQAHENDANVYIFGRSYTGGDLGVHDVHMNQGSRGGFVNNGRDDHNDHNDIWQDGAVIVEIPGQPEAAAYFTAFTQQNVPTDELGNPVEDSHEIADGDDGSMKS